MEVREETTVQPIRPAYKCYALLRWAFFFYRNTYNMHNSKIAKATSLQITEGLTVTVYPNSNHGFLISTKELAKAYGKSVHMVHKAVDRAGKRLTCSHSLNYIKSAKYGLNIGTRSVLWTMEGFFFIGEFFKTGNIKEVKDFKDVCPLNVQSKAMGGRSL